MTTRFKLLAAAFHPTGQYGVIGPLSNMREFKEAFHCAPTSAMVRPDAKRCEVW